MKNVLFQDLGTIEYAAAWDLQEALLKRNLDVKAARYNQSETASQTKSGDASIPASESTEHHLLFCTHPHVYTLGKSGHIENLLVNAVELGELNATFYKTNRGGDITYHGPGQIVGYPVLDLEHFFTDLGRYMRSLEEVIIIVLRQWGIEAGRLKGATGVWLDPDGPRARKICAMGVKCSRWVTIHGFALNVNTDLSYFGHIVPCGISDKAVTSMKQELGREIDEMEVKRQLKDAFGTVFEASITEVTPIPATL